MMDEQILNINKIYLDEINKEIILMTEPKLVSHELMEINYEMTKKQILFFILTNFGLFCFTFRAAC